MRTLLCTSDTRMYTADTLTIGYGGGGGGGGSFGGGGGQFDSVLTTSTCHCRGAVDSLMK
jgi:hypothetical protein